MGIALALIAAAAWFMTHPPTVAALLLATACGELSSVAPYVADRQALRRIPVSVFATLTSINPVWAALAGMLILHQTLGVNEWIGIGLIVVSNVVVSGRGALVRMIWAHTTAVKFARRYIEDIPGGTYASSPTEVPIAHNLVEQIRDLDSDQKLHGGDGGI